MCSRISVLGGGVGDAMIKLNKDLLNLSYHGNGVNSCMHSPMGSPAPAPTAICVKNGIISGVIGGDRDECVMSDLKENGKQYI